MLDQILEAETSHLCVPGKGGHSGVVPSTAMCLNPGGFGEDFYNNGSRVGADKDQGVYVCAFL